MDRDEQRGLPRAREVHAVAERDEGVVGARHDHAVLAGLFDLVAQQQAEFEHDGLLQLAARRLGAVVDAAVARIDDDERARIAGGLRLRTSGPACGVSGARLSSAIARMNASRSTAARSSTRRAGCPLPASSTKAFSMRAGRARSITDARAALHHQAEPERLDQAAALLAGLGRKLERDLRHVDDHPVGVGEREGADVDLAAEIDDEARLRFVAADPHVARDREVVRCTVSGSAARR